MTKHITIHNTNTVPLHCVLYLLTISKNFLNFCDLSYGTTNIRRKRDVVSTLDGSDQARYWHLSRSDRNFVFSARKHQLIKTDRQKRCGDQLQDRTCHLRTAVAGSSTQVPTAQCRISECLHSDAQCPENLISLTLTGSCKVTTGTGTIEGKANGHRTTGREGPEWE